MIVAVFSLGGDMLDIFGDLTDSWITLEARAEERADTKIAGPTNLSVTASSTVQITLVNEGKVALARYADWDVIFEIQKGPGLGVSYLTYTASSSPAASEWTVQAIYLSAASSTPEIVDPGVFNPGEEMVLVANPSPSVKAGTYDRATFVTPAGVVAKVIFEVTN